MLKSVLAAALALSATAGAHAAQFVTNGGFESTLLAQSSEFGDRCSSQQVTGWSTSGYNWVFRPGEADTVGGNGEYGNLALHGPGNGTANGLTESPFGGNYVAADGAFATAAIYQQLSGLIVGAQYAVTFSYAGAQQRGFDGATTEGWVVDLGTLIPTDSQRRSNTLSATAQITGNDLNGNLVNANHGFTGWRTQTFVFTAQTANDILSFLAIGTPDGLPPFTLLDGVTAIEAGTVPEPATWALMIGGFAMVGFAARRRRTATVAA